MMNSYQTVLESMVAEPDRRLLDLEYLAVEERQKLLTEWNNTQEDYPKDKCVHELFEAQVTRTADATALVFEESRLTYRELNCRVNQLAHYLRTLGVGPEVLVGIYLERSLEMIVAILGVLKAGGAYMPLDPLYPEELVKFMLEDSQAPILLTQERMVAAVEKFKSRVVCIDLDWNEIAHEPVSAPVSGVSPDNLAYVIYTSGSTGKPKGVMIQHRGLTNYLSWCSRVYEADKGCGTLLHSSLAFDLTITSLFPPLLAGKIVFVLPENGGIEALADALLRRDNYSLLKITPAHLKVLSELVPADQVAGRVRALVIGGEALHLDDLSFWRRHASATRLLNEYGPTETVVGCCVYEVRADDSASGPVPIGRAVANTQLYVLDENRKPVGIGVAGEVYIGGDGVARGYLNRPDLTAERFIGNPFNNALGARIYKTGDLARYRPNGEIEYLGRIDNQVKIRGYRIELGEVQTVLSQCPDVRENLVIAREDQPGDKRLVAYVVLNQLPTGKLGDLRNYLEHKLPHYMIPSAFVELDKLPLTPNGKIDTKALPLPERSEVQFQASFVAPRDEIESSLVGIWQSVLGNERFGVRDSFFELGGNSLLAARMFGETNRFFGRNLPLATLFQGNTIEHLAYLIRGNGGNESTDWSSLVGIQTGGSKKPFFFVHGVGGNVLGYRGLAHLLGPDQPFYGLQSVGLSGEEPPLRSIEAMAKHYLEAVCGAQPEGPYLLGGLSFGGIVAFEMARQLQMQGREVACVALLDASAYLCGGNHKQRIQMHLGNLLSLSSSERLDYLRRMAKTGKRKIKSRIWKVGYELYRYNPDQLPKTLQNVKEINYQAAREYAIEPYPGRVALFRASDRTLLDREDDLLGWDEFTAGVDLYRVSGDHLGMINEPHVRGLAEQLKLCFRRALEP